MIIVILNDDNSIHHIETDSPIEGYAEGNTCKPNGRREAGFNTFYRDGRRAEDTRLINVAATSDGFTTNRD